MRDLFKPNKNPYNNKVFQKPNVETETYGKKSIRNFGPIVWDEMLPAKFKSINKLEKFKDEIKKWVPLNCRCSLCQEYVGGVGIVTTFE